MKTRGLLAMVVIAAAVVYFVYFMKSGGSASAVEVQVDRFQRTKIELTGVNLGQAERAVLAYQSSEGVLPASLKEVAAARILAGPAADAWGRAFRYEKLSDTSFRLTSAGPDGTFDTEDDIVRDF